MERPDALPWLRYEKSYFALSSRFLVLALLFARFSVQVARRRLCRTRPPSRPRPTPCSPSSRWSKRSSCWAASTTCLRAPCPPSICRASRCPMPRWACAPGDRRRPMPAALALAASWDTDLARKIGEGLGRDARARSVNFLLGPGVNIARSPIAGRNFEYLSEDPYLNATMVVPFIEGVQSQGVIATVKHYALNDQEFNRHNASSDVDERTMREIYLPGLRGRRHQGPRRRRHELLQPGQRRPRHAKRLPQSPGAQGRVGIPGHSYVRLGRDLRRRRRLQQRSRSRDAQP